jgi:hypothetical protein
MLLVNKFPNDVNYKGKTSEQINLPNTYLYNNPLVPSQEEYRPRMFEDLDIDERNIKINIK